MENSDNTALERIARTLRVIKWLIWIMLPPIAGSLVSLAVPIFPALGFGLFLVVTLVFYIIGLVIVLRGV